MLRTCGSTVDGVDGVDVARSATEAPPPRGGVAPPRGGRCLKHTHLSREGAARLQPAAREVQAKDVLLMDVLLVQGQVILLQVLGLLMEALVQVLRPEVVREVFVVLLSSLSPTPTTHPRTRPAARVWAWGAKGLGCLIVLPAPGQRSSGDVSSNTGGGLVRHGVGCAGPVGVDSANQNDDRVQPRAVKAETVNTTRSVTSLLLGHVSRRQREAEGGHDGSTDPFGQEERAILARAISRGPPAALDSCSSYTKVSSVIYDSGSVICDSGRRSLRHFNGQGAQAKRRSREARWLAAPLPVP